MPRYRESRRVFSAESVGGISSRRDVFYSGASSRCYHLARRDLDNYKIILLRPSLVIICAAVCLEVCETVRNLKVQPGQFRAVEQRFILEERIEERIAALLASNDK